MLLLDLADRLGLLHQSHRWHQWLLLDLVVPSDLLHQWHRWLLLDLVVPLDQLLL